MVLLAYAELCRNFAGELPAEKYQNSGVTFEHFGKNLRSLNTQTDAFVLNGRDGSLPNPGEAGELTLAQLLKLAKNPHGFPYRDIDSLFCETITFNLRPPIVMCGDRCDLERKSLNRHAIDDAPLKP